MFRLQTGMVKMDGIREKKDRPVERERRSSLYVKWIAIGVGVFMIMIGGLILLWGFSYQATVGEPSDLDGGKLTGGPLLIPLGAISITFGALWLFYGFKGFRRSEDEVGMKKCPNCGKLIEEDLNFCYHCTTTFATREEEMRIERSQAEDDVEEEIPSEDECLNTENGPSRGQVQRSLRKEERRKRSGSDCESRPPRAGRKEEPQKTVTREDQPARKARSLEGFGNGEKGR